MNKMKTNRLARGNFDHDAEMKTDAGDRSLRGLLLFGFFGRLFFLFLRRSF